MLELFEQVFPMNNHK